MSGDRVTHFPAPSAADFATYIDRDFDLGALEGSQAQIVAGLVRDAEDAKTLGDPALVRVTQARVETAAEHQVSAQAALVSLEAAEREYRRAVDRAVRAAAVAYAGTLDAAEAVKQEHERIAACAAERVVRSRLPAARAALTRALNAIIKLRKDDDGAARERAFNETKEIVDAIVSEYGDASTTAGRQGREATRQIAMWWPIAELRARDDAKTRIASYRGRKSVPLNAFEAAIAVRRASFEEKVGAARRNFEALTSTNGI